jgi:hypothetical protein
VNHKHGTSVQALNDYVGRESKRDIPFELQSCQLTREAIDDHLHVPWSKLARIHLVQDNYA